MAGNHSILALSNVSQSAAIMLLHTACCGNHQFALLSILLILLALNFSVFLGFLVAAVRKPTRFRMLRPSSSNFHTTSVSPSDSVQNTFLILDCWTPCSTRHTRMDGGDFSFRSATPLLFPLALQFYPSVPESLHDAMQMKHLIYQYLKYYQLLFHRLKWNHHQ